MLDTIQSLVALGAIALSAWGLGRPLARWFRIAPADPLATLVWSLALGFVVAGQGLTVWGLVGGLSAPAIRYATMAAATLGGIQVLWSLARGWTRTSRPSTATDAQRASAAFDVGHWTFDVERSAKNEHRTSHVPRPTSNKKEQRARLTCRLLTVAAWGLSLLAAGGSLVSALAPPVAGDALCYHLELPKVFLSHGSI